MFSWGLEKDTFIQIPLSFLLIDVLNRYMSATVNLILFLSLSNFYKVTNMLLHKNKQSGNENWGHDDK